MTLQEAQQMLDAQKEDEKALIFSAENKPAQSADAKLKEGEVADFLIRGRLTAMESRQTDMERRLNTPPPPAPFSS